MRACSRKKIKKTGFSLASLRNFVMYSSCDHVLASAELTGNDYYYFFLYTYLYIHVKNKKCNTAHSKC